MKNEDDLKKNEKNEDDLLCQKDNTNDMAGAKYSQDIDNFLFQISWQIKNK